MAPMREQSELRPGGAGPTTAPPAGPPRRPWSGTLAASFSFAIAGLVEAAARDRNMRIHLGAGVLASCFAALAPVSAAERAIVLVCVALVISAEAANSAIEAVVDLASPGFDPRARVAKDAAAGAVLALACGAVAAFLCIALPARPLALARALPVETGASLVAAVAVGLLPAPGRRRVTGAVLAVAAAVALALVALRAASPLALAAAALLLVVSAGGARRGRRDPAGG
jgi:diacylglycerol kinase (ATP)